MNSILIRKAVRRSLARVRYVTPVPPGAAQGLVAQVYVEVERDFGVLAPPVVLHSPSPSSLAASWLLISQTLVGGDPAGRAAREVVAAAVSAANSCPYCVTIHTSALDQLLGGGVPAQITAGRIEAISDPRLRQLAQWARYSGQRPAGARGGPAVPAGQFPELAGVAVSFHYLNRMVTVFLDESPLPAAVPAALRRRLMRMTAAVMLSPAGGSPARGAALDLLPAAQLPAEFSWAAGEPRVGTALARADAAIEAASVPVVPESVRELILDELKRWDGQPLGPNRSWADAAVGGLTAADRPAGRLALLTAFAPYQVIPSDISEFRRGQPADEALIQFTSWVSMATARRIGSWLTEPART